MANTGHEIKHLDTGKNDYDLSAEFARLNPDIVKNFGNDRYTYTPELHGLNAMYWAEVEAKKAHGYPKTAWLQLGLLYGCGIYTAQEQGIIKRNVFVCRFWKAHYFDWLTFLNRSVKYAWIGGLVAGTVMFGNPHVALKRMQSKYALWMHNGQLDFRATETTIVPRM